MKFPEPVLITDAFAVNSEFQVEKIDDVVIIDNLFKDWVKVRNCFIYSPPFNWKMPKGTRNFIDYYDCRHFFSHYEGFPFDEPLRKVIKHVYGNDTELVRNGIRTNWFKQIKPKTSEWAQLHFDHTKPNEEFTMITFLNTDEECSGGTSIFKGLKDIDGHTGMDYWSNLKYYGNPLNIEMKPGRTIIFPSELVHAAWHPIDSFYDFPRHNMVCRFVPL